MSVIDNITIVNTKRKEEKYNKLIKRINQHFHLKMHIEGMTQEPKSQRS